MTPASAPLRILVADDSATVRKFIERALEDYGDQVAVVSVADGQKALSYLRTSPVDIAFLDVMMPGLSGIEVIGASHAMHMTTMAVSMSDGLTASREKILRSFGTYDFLTKPFTALEVRRIVESYRVIRTPFDMLIVDDSTTVRNIVKKVIGRSIFNIEMHEAANGDDALQAVARMPFKVIFSDFNMPGMSGVELAEKLAKVARGADVILMSTEFTVAIDEAARKVGACAFLHKPFYPEDVDTILHHLFRLPHPRLSKQVRMFATV